jgi:hypothetical protein
VTDYEKYLAFLDRIPGILIEKEILKDINIIKLYQGMHIFICTFRKADGKILSLSFDCGLEE